jgi:hypothetical protein
MPSETLPGTSANPSAEMLSREGYALLGPVLSAGVVADLEKEFERRYSYLKLPGAKIDDSLKTGDGRYMLTVELSGAFGDFQVYANPSILEILNIVFDRKFVLDSFGAVLSFPGAKAQHTHRDGGGLFGTALDALLPAYAVTVGIPLIGMNLEQGTTELFPNSHRGKESSSSVVPDVPAGCGIMWDYRTLHRGTENRSDRYRPLLYMTYSRPWWRDLDNFEPEWSDSGPPTSQKKVVFGKDFFKSVPLESRFLLRNVDGVR